MTSDARSFRYEQCDIPEGLTLTDWRHLNHRPRRRFLRRLLHL